MNYFKIEVILLSIVGLGDFKHVVVVRCNEDDLPTNPPEKAAIKWTSDGFIIVLDPFTLTNFLTR